MIARGSPIDEYKIFRHPAVGPIFKSRIARCGNGGVDCSRHVKPAIFRYLAAAEFTRDLVELFGAQISKRSWLDLNGPCKGWFAASGQFERKLASFGEAPQFTSRKQSQWQKSAGPQKGRAENWHLHGLG